MTVAALLAAVLVVSAPPLALADTPYGAQFTINGGPGPFVGGAGAPVDLSEALTFAPAVLPPYSPQGTGPFGVSGTSAYLLVELSGVAPETLTGASPVVISDSSRGARATFSDTLSSGEVLAGFYAADGYLSPGNSNPDYALVQNLGGLTNDQGVGNSQEYLRPLRYAGDVNDRPAGGFADQTPGAGSFDVALTIRGTPLGVATPAFNPSNPGVAAPIAFSVPGSVTLGLASGSPVDPNALTRFSWNFGDGTPLVLTTGRSATHAYSAQGAYDVRVTVADAAGNEGVSPQAAVVPVGPPVGSTGSTGQTGPANPIASAGAGAGSAGRGGGGKAPTGGGTGATNTLSSGAAHGSAAVSTSSVAPRVTGRPASRPVVPTASPLSPSSSAAGLGTDGGARSGAKGGGTGRRGAGAAGAGSPGAQGKASGGITTGAGGSRPPKSRTTPGLGSSATAGLVGVLLESSGAPLSDDALTSQSPSTLSLLQSVARRSVGSSGGAGTIPAWLIGLLALIGFVVSGVMRESGHRGLGRFGVGRA